MGVRLSVGGWVALSLGVLLLVVAAAFLGPAGTLQSKMTQRFLEAEGRSPEQLAARAAEQRRAEQARLEAERQAAEARRLEQAQREADARRAQEEAARRQEQAEIARRQQEERRQLEARYAALLQEWYAIFDPHWAEISKMMANVEAAQPALIEASRRVSPLALQNPNDPDNYTSERACENPTLPPSRFAYEPPGPSNSRYPLVSRHIASCAYRLAVFRPDRPTVMYLAMTALLRRTQSPGQASAEQFPVQSLIATIWIGIIQHPTARGEPSPIQPPRDASTRFGNTYYVNRELFRGIPALFVDRFFELMTEREKNDFIQFGFFNSIARLYEIAPQIVALCRSLQRTDCLRRV